MSINNSYIFKFKDLNKIEFILDWFENNSTHTTPVKIKIDQNQTKEYHFLHFPEPKETIQIKELSGKGDLVLKFKRTEQSEADWFAIHNHASEIKEEDGYLHSNPLSFKIVFGHDFFNVELVSYFNSLSHAMTSKTLLDLFFKFCEEVNPYVAFIGIENKPGRILWLNNKKADIQGPHSMDLNQPDDIKFLE